MSSKPPVKKGSSGKKTLSKPPQTPKDGADVNAIKVKDMSFEIFFKNIKDAFPDNLDAIKEQDIREEYDRLIKVPLAFKYAKEKIGKNIRNEGRISKKIPAILFGSSDQPNKKVNAEDGTEKFEDPYKTNVSTYFFENDTFGKLDMGKKDSVEKLAIQWGKKVMVGVEQQASKNAKYSDYMWIHKVEDPEDVDLEEIFKKHYFFPDYFDEDFVTDQNGDMNYPVMVLYGTIGSFFPSHDFVDNEETGEREMTDIPPLVETKDGQTKLPSFTFTVYNKELIPEGEQSTRSVFVSFPQQKLGRSDIKLEYGDLSEQLEEYMKDESLSTADILGALTDLYGGGSMRVFVVGYPRKLEWKNDKLNVNFIATGLYETKFVPEEFPEYDAFAEWYINSNQPHEVENTAQSVKEAKGDVGKAKQIVEQKKIDLLKKKIAKGVDALGKDAKYEDLVGGGFITATDNEGEQQLIGRLIDECKEESGNKTEPKEEKKEADKKEPSESEEEDKEDGSEEGAEEKEEAPAEEELDPTLVDILKKAEDSKLGTASRNVIKYIFNSENPEGLTEDEIVKGMEIKKATLVRILGQLVSMKFIYSPKDGQYAIVI